MVAQTRQEDASGAALAAARAVAMVSPRDGVVSLGPILPDDVANLFLWLNDADAAAGDIPYRPVDCLAFKEWLEKLPMQASQLLFAIRAQDRARLVGFVLFKNFQQVFRSVEVGVRIGVAEERGKGYGTRALRLALVYAWDTLNMHRVSLTVFAENQVAIAAYRRAGFHEEGMMRHAAFTAGRWHDVVVMAALNPRERPGG